jgi:sensor histidine kinase regulating citrate/malate metabolism
MAASSSPGVLLTLEHRGIGVSSVREVVRQHGGTVEIASQDGGGSGYQFGSRSSRCWLQKNEARD